MTPTQVELREWESAGPETHPALTGLSFGESEDDRQIAANLSKAGSLRVTELTAGLSVEATSYVGSVHLGPLHITVSPKVEGSDLLALLKYALGLRNLRLFPEHQAALARNSFRDILICQLAAEASELVSRGLHRTYRRRQGMLSSPRGRIDFRAFAADAGVAHAALPCRYHRRLEDCLHNQVLLAGLRLSIQLTADVTLRARLRNLAGLIEADVSEARLDRRTFRRLRGASSRLTRAYDPAVRLIAALTAGQGATTTGRRSDTRIPGFLFDMNRFFQALLSRFLNENLTGHVVRDELRLRGMLSYVPGYNPRHRRAPEPRPDFVVLRGADTVAVLDAKYRDLWSNPLPRDMLYQLAIYALSRGEDASATILYPTTDEAATDARVRIRDPVSGTNLATVVQRPVIIPHLAQLVAASRSLQSDRARAAYCRELVFGVTASDQVVSRASPSRAVA